MGEASGGHDILQNDVGTMALVLKNYYWCRAEDNVETHAYYSGVLVETLAEFSEFDYLKFSSFLREKYGVYAVNVTCVEEEDSYTTTSAADAQRAPPIRSTTSRL